MNIKINSNPQTSLMDRGDFLAMQEKAGEGFVLGDGSEPKPEQLANGSMPMLTDIDRTKKDQHINPDAVTEDRICRIPGSCAVYSCACCQYLCISL